MTFSTGGAARLVDATEPQLAELVRRGKIRPEPRVVAGRRLWTRDHVLAAAACLGRDLVALERVLAGSGPDGASGSGSARLDERPRS